MRRISINCPVLLEIPRRWRCVTFFGAEICHFNDNQQVQSFIQIAPSRS
jgi:hypothetical protein